MVTPHTTRADAMFRIHEEKFKISIVSKTKIRHEMKLMADKYGLLYFNSSKTKFTETHNIYVT